MVDRLAKRVQQSWETLDAITDYCHSRFVLRAPRTRVIAFATVPANAPLTPGRAWCTLRAERDRAALEDMYGRQLEQLGSKFREKMGTMDDKLGSASNPTHAAMGPGSHCSCNVCAVAGGGGVKGALRRVQDPAAGHPAISHRGHADGHNALPTQDADRCGGRRRAQGSRRRRPRAGQANTRPVLGHGSMPGPLHVIHRPRKWAVPAQRLTKPTVGPGKHMHSLVLRLSATTRPTNWRPSSWRWSSST